MFDTNKLYQFIRGMGKMFEPLFNSSISSDNRDLFFSQLGWDFTIIPDFPTDLLDDSLVSFANNETMFLSYLITLPDNFSDLISMLNSLQTQFSLYSNISTSINSSTAINSDVKTEFNTLSTELFDFLLSSYLINELPTVNSILEIACAINRTETSNVYDSYGNLIRNAYQKITIDFENFTNFISNNFSYLTPIYYPSGTTLATISDATTFSNSLFPKLQLLFQSLGFNTSYGINSAFSSYFTTDQYNSGIKTLLISKDNGSGSQFGFAFNMASVEEGDLGLTIVPIGSFNFSQTWGVWDFVFLSTGELPSLMLKDDQIILPSTFTGTNLNFSVALTNNQILGNSGIALSFLSLGYNVQLSFYDVSALFSLTTNGSNETDYKFEFSVNDASFIILPGLTDSFISNVISDNGINVDFNFTIGYRRLKGLYINGGLGFTEQIPVHISNDYININSISTSVYIQSGNIYLSLTTSFSAILGPVTVTIENIGVSGELSFPSSGGNLGKLNFNTAFQPPDGIGVDIEADAISGGGFLDIDIPNNRYVGALQLTIQDQITVSAVGIITTKMPDGSSGYSMLFMLNVQFNPGIPLGFGFTLNGVGGIGGVNRTMSTTAIMQGVQSGAINAIMFPSDALSQVNTIITDLNTFFPVQQGRYTFGLLFQIQWGEDIPLITINLGLIISMPAPVVLAIIGTVKIVLPTPGDALLQINAAFAGVIDFDNQYLLFDATIYNSYIVTFSLSGDISVRMFWGTNKEMLLSVGGFNPAYNPPAYLLLPAKMNRMVVSIIDDSTLQITLTCYFALTSNTVQFGADVKLKFNFAIGQLDGDLGFDVLFQFNPFHLIADVYASLSLKVGGAEVLTLHMDLTLSGPDQWHAQGSAKFKLLWFKHSVNINKTWGSNSTEVPVPSIAMIPLLVAALSNPQNWQSTIPVDQQLMVTLLPPSDTSLVIMPHAVLSIVQKVVPLDINIQRYGAQTLSDGGFYNIASVQIGGTAQTLTVINDSFAPAQFLNMTDAQKLAAPSFEYLQSGVQLQVDDVNGWPPTVLADIVLRTVSYNVVIVDQVHRIPPTPASLDSFLVNNFINGGVISKNAVKVKSTRQITKPISNVTLKNEQYAMLTKDMLSPTGTVYNSKAQAASYMNTYAAGASMVAVPSL